ncbi:MAG: NAD-dependent epimerase/dehydratase family protein, partial [Candidatus Levybacteria bacterium]|nr:NAD-dependent epimerase/dehydratase family protein [Candidatus Levybacteria bacterium]
MKKILVTGDRGYIGAVLTPLLIKYGYEVIGLDTEYFRFTINNKALFPRYKKITKDIRKIEKKDIAGINTIIHLSALSNDSMGDIDSNLTEEINFQASVRLAEIAKDVGVKRFIFSSSCSVYGGHGKIPVTEKDAVDP